MSDGWTIYQTDPRLGVAICFQVKSKLPSTLKAYRSQQHRWSCGPALLFKKMFSEIIVAKVSLVHCALIQGMML